MNAAETLDVAAYLIVTALTIFLACALVGAATLLSWIPKHPCPQCGHIH